uniref:Secreted protein n=1 Tax=Arundo donax TaxID=35708 RepID=A0A0A9E0D7_ARUDO
MLSLTISACASASCAWRVSTCCCSDVMAPTQPYTGSLTRAFASYTRLLTASPRCCTGISWSSLLTLLAPKTLCTLANLCGSPGGK